MERIPADHSKNQESRVNPYSASRKRAFDLTRKEERARKCRTDRRHSLAMLYGSFFGLVVGPGIVTATLAIASYLDDTIQYSLIEVSAGAPAGLVVGFAWTAGNSLLCVGARRPVRTFPGCWSFLVCAFLLYALATFIVAFVLIVPILVGMGLFADGLSVDSEFSKFVIYRNRTAFFTAIITATFMLFLRMPRHEATDVAVGKNKKP